MLGKKISHSNSNPNSNASKWMREELLHLLAVCATLSGLCITVVALMTNFERTRKSVTIVDDIFAICALFFLICMYIIFFAMRARTPDLEARLIKLVDIIFLLAMTCMTLAAFVMVYTVW